MVRTMTRALLDLEYPARRALAAPGRAAGRWRNRRRLARPSGGAVSVFAINDRLLLEEQAWWIGKGAWTPSGRIHVISGDRSNHELGEALLSALKRSTFTRVRSGRQDSRDLVDVAGVASDRALQRSAKYVAVQSEGGVVKLMSGTPLAGGWITEEEGIQMVTPDPEQVGEALRGMVDL